MPKTKMNTLLFWVKLNQRDILFRIYYVFCMMNLFKHQIMILFFYVDA